MEKTVIILLLLLHVAVGSPVNDLSLGDKLLSRPMRGIKDWKIFAKSSTKAPPTTTKPPILPNNLEFGNCEEDDKIIYVDDTRIESNNSTLGGVLEIHIDSPYYITCVKVLDQMPLGTGAVPTYNSGGSGEKFVFINVQGQYGHGIHFRIILRGKVKESENEMKA